MLIYASKVKNNGKRSKNVATKSELDSHGNAGSFILRRPKTKQNYSIAMVTHLRNNRDEQNQQYLVNLGEQAPQSMQTDKALRRLTNKSANLGSHSSRGQHGAYSA